MMLYFLNSRIPIEIETYEDYLWVQSKFHQDCCSMLSLSLCPRLIKSLVPLGLYLIPTVEHYFVQVLPQEKCLCVGSSSLILKWVNLDIVYVEFDILFDSLCTYDNQRQRTVIVFIICTVYIEYLPFFLAINVFCCIY